ncbi:MAG: hypothetical protein HFH08_07115 [Bacilli bacterium]|nr:hypothetical protein [Bacilli bacterium]
MEILTDNYIWIIVIVVVILMTIIGYIAEKTNFGKKEFSKKKNDKKELEKKEVIKAEAKIPEVPVATSTVEMPKVEKTVEIPSVPNEPINPVPKEPETVHFRDPLADDMNVSSEVLKSTYEEPAREEVLTINDDLNAPFGESSYNMPNESSFEASEDLNAPFGDFAIPSENIEEDLNVPLTETSHNTSYNMADEDLNVPFGDNAEIPAREDFDLNLPDIDSIKEDINTTVNNENDDDDIWKF